MATPGTHPRKLETLDDRELARLATAGDGHAFAQLYDRHERRVYGFCMRMLGTPHDAADATQETFVRMLGRLPALEGRELNFAAYALAAARNACYDMIEGRRRIEPVADEPDGSGVGQYGPPDDNLERDPERAALLAAAREDVRVANAELPARQREVLALREVELLSYDEIGELMGLNRNAVAQLVSRARIKLRDLLRGSALASVSASSANCAKALPLLASIQDDERGDPDELDWAHAHLAECDTCRLAQAAMQEAGVSYRALAPIAPLLWLRHATIARAAELVGADWSHIAPNPASDAHGPAGEQTPRPRPPSDAHGPTSGATGEQALGDSQQTEALPGNGVHSSRVRLARWSALGAALLALCLLLIAMTGITRDGHIARQALPAVDQPVHLTTTAVPAHRVHHPAIVLPSSKPEQPLALHGSAPSDGPRVTITPVKPHHQTTRVRSNHHRVPKPKTKRPAPPVVTTPPASTTGPTPNPPTPTPPPTTTTPPTQTTPAPAPPTTTGSGETTETSTTPVPPERPGLIP